MKTIVKAESTAIGSLPHHNVDAALDFSFKTSIPFLPQIPIRNPWEYMIPQALEGIPGLLLESDGALYLNREIWQSQSHSLSNRLNAAFAQDSNRKEAFESFEPSVAISSCWQPFIWELEERNVKLAKLQIAGPMTAQWALRIKDGSSPDQYPELSTQIFRLVLARSLAMVYRVLSSGIQPILYLDEPGLYALSLTDPKHFLCLQELKLLIQTLRKAGAIVGLHCCSNTRWKAVFDLGLDILSIDTVLSLRPALELDEGKAMENFIRQGGRLSLGIIPTGRSSVLQTLDSRILVDELLVVFEQYWKTKPDLIKKTLTEAIYTPACGLALQSTSDAELILDKLLDVYEYFAS